MSPTVKSRQLGADLRRYRLRCRLTCERAGRAVGMSTAKISRIENGRNSGSPTDIAMLLGLYRVPKDKQDELLDLCTTSNDRGWWQRHGRRLSPGLTTLISLENDATAIYNFEPNLIPGLVQTGDYARAFMRGSGVLNEDEIEERIIVRLGRQAMLSRPRPPQLHLIIDEQILRRPVGGLAVMQEQLEVLQRRASRDFITLRIVPLSIGAHPGLSGPFMLLDFAKVPAVVQVEGETSSLILEEDQDLATYRSVWRRLAKLALDPEQSIALVARLATDYAEARNGALDDQARRRGLAWLDPC